MRIKRKTTNQLTTLIASEGELLFNEYRDQLDYVGISAINSIGGNTKLLSIEADQQINGNISLTPLLSSAHVDNINLNAIYNPVAVVNTKYVKDSLAIIDGGDLDSDIKVGVGSYWYTDNSLLTSWFILENWYFDEHFTIHAAELPNTLTHVVLSGEIAPYVDLLDARWVQPASIDANATGITFYAAEDRQVDCDITSINYPVVFLDHAHYSGN